jgi:hypothetical protein
VFRDHGPRPDGRDGVVNWSRSANDCLRSIRGVAREERTGGPSTRAVSNRSVMQRYRENGEAGCRFAGACPSAFPGKRRTCSRCLPTELESSAPWPARGTAEILVGLRTPSRSNFGTQKARLRRKAARPGARSTGHWSATGPSATFAPQKGSMPFSPWNHRESISRPPAIGKALRDQSWLLCEGLRLTYSAIER